MLPFCASISFFCSSYVYSITHFDYCLIGGAADALLTPTRTFCSRILAVHMYVHYTTIILLEWNSPSRRHCINRSIDHRFVEN